MYIKSNKAILKKFLNPYEATSMLRFINWTKTENKSEQNKRKQRILYVITCNPA